MKKYKAAVIGCGRIGAEEWCYPQNIRPATHAATYFGHPKIELVGLCDIDSEKLKKAKKFFPGVFLYNSAKKMLGTTKPDIVSVATHTNTHYRFVKMAADFGAKAIVCEKPMADSTKKAELMIKACKRKKCLLFINHSRHFDSLINKWQKRVQGGALGKVLQVNSFYHNGFFNNGTHIIDLLIWFLGKAEKVSGVYNSLTSNSQRDKNIDAVIYFKNSARAFIQSLPEKRGLTEWFFYGQKGDLFLKKLGMEINYKNTTMEKQRSLMSQMVSYVISCLEKKQKPKSTGEEALSVLKILFSIKKSADNNGKIINVIR